MKEEFFQGPAVIRQTGSQSWGAGDPMEAMPTHRKAEAHAFVEVARVIDATEDIHTLLQGGTLASQMAGTTKQANHTLAEDGIEPFDVGSIDDTASLRCVEPLVRNFLSFAINPYQSMIM
jgi:hypothetical protein